MVLAMLALGLAAPSDVYPHAGASPTSMRVLDLRGETDFARLSLAASAQGLINARASGDKVFLVWDKHDEKWAKWIAARGMVRTVGQIPGLAELIAMTGTRQAIVSEGTPPHIANVATLAAGCEGALLVVDPKLLAEFGLRAKVDLRGRFKTNVEAYRWVLATYGDRMTRRATSITVPFKTPTHTPAQLRDYLVANRVFTWWISGREDGKLPGADRQAEESFLREVLRTEFPTNIPTMGYPWSGDEYGPGEWDGITFLSQTGRFLIPTDNFSNLSFWSTFPRSPRKLPQPQVKVVPEPGRRYAALLMSDGDNLCTWRDFFPGYWEGLKDRSFPVAWTMGPTLAELAPPIYDWAVENVPAGHTVGAGVSGVGYMAMEEYAKDLRLRRQGVVDAYARLTGEWSAATGQRWLWVMRYGQPGGWGIRQYAKIPGIQAIMGGYGLVTSDLRASIERFGDATAFHTVMRASNLEDLRKELPPLAARPDCPPLLNIFILNWNYSPEKLAETAAFVRSQGFEIVSPEVLATLARG